MLHTMYKGVAVSIPCFARRRLTIHAQIRTSYRMPNCPTDRKISGRYDAILRLLAYYFCSLIIAALLTPVCFNFVLLWHQYSPSQLTNYLVRKGFVIFFERIRILALLIFLPSLLRLGHQLQLSHKFIHEFNRDSCKLSLRYAFLGEVLICFVVFIELFSGKQEFFFQLPELSGMNLLLLGKIFIGVLLLSVFEEFLFRGIIFDSIRRFAPDSVALIGSSLLFAYFHFRPQYQAPTTYGFLSGFQCLYEVILYTPKFIAWDKFALLFSFGVFLSAAVRYTKSLYASIGIHFGTVIALIFFQKNTYFLDGSHPISLQTIIDSPWTYLLLWGIALYFYIKKGHFKRPSIATKATEKTN